MLHQWVWSQSQGRNSSKAGTWGRNWSRSHGGTLLFGFLTSHGLLGPSYTSQHYVPWEVAPPTGDCTLLHQSSIKRMLHKVTHKPVWWGYFYSFFSNGSSLCWPQTNQNRRAVLWVKPRTVNIVKFSQSCVAASTSRTFVSNPTVLSPLEVRAETMLIRPKLLLLYPGPVSGPLSNLSTVKHRYRIEF